MSLQKGDIWTQEQTLSEGRQGEDTEVGDSHVPGVMHRKAFGHQDCQQIPEARRISCCHQRRHGPADTLILEL